MTSANSPTLVQIAKSLGQKHGTCAEAAAAMELLVAKAFIVVFFFVRVCVCGADAHRWQHYWKGTFGGSSLGAEEVVLRSFCSGTGLGAYWFKIMMFKALGLSRKRRSRARREGEREARIARREVRNERGTPNVFRARSVR